jgi:endoglucanase
MHLICTVALAAASTFPFSAQAWQGMAIPKLHVNGNNIQDPSGKNVLLHGYFQPQASWFNGQGNRYSNPSDYTSTVNVAPCLNFLTDAANVMTTTSPLYGRSHGWYCSFVRIVGDGSSPENFAPGWDANGNLSDSAQFNGWINNLLVPFINQCRSRGLYVVICGNPSVAYPGGDGTKNMTYQYQQNLITYWTTLANNAGIKSADNVMFEICNEPVAIETSFGANNWGSGSGPYWSALKGFMQPVVNAIRNTGADNIIWVPSLGWEGECQGFAQYPVTGSNVGYAGHFYPGYGNVHDNQTAVQNLWNSNYKPCADHYPMIITEMYWYPNPIDGQYDDLFAGSTSGFGNAAKAAIDNQGNVSYLVGFLADNLYNLVTSTPANCTLGSGDGAQAAFDWWSAYTWAAPTTGSATGGTVKLIARHSGKALEASGFGAANGTQIQQWAYVGGASQQWTINNVGNNQYSIIGVQSGKCIDISNWGTTNGTKVQLWDYLGGSNQKYSFTATDSGYYEISPSHATSSCLDVSGVSTSDGAVVQLWTYGGGQNQQWLIQPVDGTVKLVARHSSKALDASGGQTANGTQLIQWGYGGGANQKWTVTDTGGGNYSIIGVQSGKAVDVSNGGTTNGTKVQLWNYMGNSAQLYKFTGTDPGYFRITPNCATGSCLDVSGISTADGANVQLWQWLGGSNQQWAPQAP